MKKKVPTISSELANIADDARTLLAVTAESAEEKVVEARKRVTEALERCQETCMDTWETVQDKTMAGVKSADKAVRSHPYETMGIAFGVGALLGYLLGKRN